MGIITVQNICLFLFQRGWPAICSYISIINCLRFREDFREKSRVDLTIIGKYGCGVSPTNFLFNYTILKGFYEKIYCVENISMLSLYLSYSNDKKCLRLHRSRYGQLRYTDRVCRIIRLPVYAKDVLENGKSLFEKHLFKERKRW